MGLVEKVALAFAGLHITTAGGTIVLPEDVARAAIEAMREPTDEMTRAVYVNPEAEFYGAPEAADVWQAMIDVALKETKVVPVEGEK